jgi:hypothetical protein
MKRTLLVAFALCLVSGVAHATDTRIQSMGGKEKAWTVDDETNVLYFPALLVRFPNVVYLDAGLSPVWAVGDGQGSNIPYNVGFGMHYAFGENTVLGFYGSSMSRYLSGDLLTRAFENKGKWATIGVDTVAGDEAGAQAIQNADHKGSVIFGQRFGKTRLGVLLSIWGDQYSIDSPETSHEKKGATIFDGNLGFGYDIDQDSSFDFGIRFWTGSFDDEKFAPGGANPIVTRFKSDSHFGFDLYGRGIFGIPGGERIVPYLNLGMEGGGIAWNQANGVKSDFSRFHLVAGADLRVQPLENVFIYPGVGVAVMTEKIAEGVNSADETIQDSLSLVAPFVSASVDARVASWFSLRFAGRQSIIINDGYHNADGVNKGKDNDTLTEFLLGAGLHFGSASIEWMLNPAWFMEGLFQSDEQTDLVLVDADGDGVMDGVKSAAPSYGDGFASQLSVKFIW